MVIGMKIECVKVRFLKCNCYLLIKNNNCLVIDPGDEADKIINMIGNRNVVGVLITHNHFDHVGCVKDLCDKYNIKSYDYYNLLEGLNKLGDFSFYVIHTLGHYKDCCTYYFKDEKVMFTGDFLFKGGIGRCDLSGGDYNLMLDSIDRIKKYDDDIIIYPGHGDSSVLGIEKKDNNYFK